VTIDRQGKLFPDSGAPPPPSASLPEPVASGPPRVLRWTLVDNPGIGRTIEGGYDGPIGQLTELQDPVTGYRLWVREVARPPGGWFYVASNYRWGLKHGENTGRHWIQILELAVSPEIAGDWDRIAALVCDVDALHRFVRRNARFTKKTALWEFRRGWITAKGEHGYE